MVLWRRCSIRRRAGHPHLRMRGFQNRTRGFGGADAERRQMRAGRPRSQERRVPRLAHHDLHKRDLPLGARASCPQRWRARRGEPKPADPPAVPGAGQPGSGMRGFQNRTQRFGGADAERRQLRAGRPRSQEGRVPRLAHHGLHKREHLLGARASCPQRWRARRGEPKPARPLRSRERASQEAGCAAIPCAAPRRWPPDRRRHPTAARFGRSSTVRCRSCLRDSEPMFRGQSAPSLPFLAPRL